MEIMDMALASMKTADLLELAQIKNVILPLYLYDHSGITMNTTGYYCPHDSAQCGWIYTSHEGIVKEYGEVTPETIEKARELLETEVEVYDYYITNQCYGFKLYKGDNQIDSCWGFYGEISDVTKYIKEHLPSECVNITDTLVYQSDINEDAYLEQTLEAEDEMEM
jgi:hypothetical protein